MSLDLLAISPHPDDAELHCGGLLRKMADSGHLTGIVDLTAGEMGTRGSVEIRMQEAAAAAEILGLSGRKNLKLPDSALAQTDDQRRTIIHAIREFRPRLLLIPNQEARHPDHRLAGILAQDAAFLAGLAKIDTAQEPYRPQQIIYYYTHYTYRQQAPSFIVDVTNQYEQKIEAIRAYKSQFFNPDSEERETYISRPEFMDEIMCHNRYYGTLIGVKYGEPYITREYLEVDDPVTFFRPGNER